MRKAKYYIIWKKLNIKIEAREICKKKIKKNWFKREKEDASNKKCRRRKKKEKKI